MLSTLTDAYQALGSLPNGPPVVLRGQEDPGGDEVIVLDRVAETAVRMSGGSASSNLIQVSCYAKTPERVLQLTQQVRATLEAAGLFWLQSRPAPSNPGEFGESSDFER